MLFLGLFLEPHQSAGLGRGGVFKTGSFVLLGVQCLAIFVIVLWSVCMAMCLLKVRIYQKGIFNTIHIHISLTQDINSKVCKLRYNTSAMFVKPWFEPIFDIDSLIKVASHIHMCRMIESITDKTRRSVTLNPPWTSTIRRCRMVSFY